MAHYYVVRQKLDKTGAEALSVLCPLLWCSGYVRAGFNEKAG